MRTLSLALGALLSLSLFACNQSVNVVPKSSGSIAISADDLLLYVADADHNALVTIDIASKQVVARTEVGTAPERVFVGKDGAVYVTNRGSRSVARVTPDGRFVEATATVGAEPVGVALTADGTHLLVANTNSGTLSVLEPTTLEARGELTVGGQPWALAPLGDNRRVYVTDYAAGTVKVVDITTGAITRTLTLDQPPSAECPWGTIPARTPAQTADVIVSPDDSRAYIAHVQSRTGMDQMSQFSLALAVAPALTTVDTVGGDTVYREPDRTTTSRDELTTGTPQANFPPALLATNLDQECRVVGGGNGMDAPSSLVVDGLGEWVFVADHNSNAVAVVSSQRRQDSTFREPERGIADVVRVGARPTGLAVAGDLRHMYVHNALDYSVSFVESVGGRLAEVAVVGFDHSPLPADVERGRKLFYSAVDPRLTQPEFGGVSCSSCHPNGGADGLTWVLPTADNGRDPWNWQTVGTEARNTPALWGVAHTAPYHWDGSDGDLPAFSTAMVAQMGGMGLNPRDLTDLSAYLGTITPPDNPNAGRLASGLLERGRQLFADRCETCHAGEQLTDGLTHVSAFGDLRSLNTPSLRGVFATAPYLHDGSAHTVMDVMRSSYPSISEHAQRSLSTADLEALDAFVRAQ